MKIDIAHLRKLIDEYVEAKSHSDWQADQGYGREVHRAAVAEKQAWAALDSYINEFTPKLYDDLKLNISKE